MKHFLDVTVGEAAARHQRRRGSFDNYERMVAAPAPVGLGQAEADFLSRRDSFYVASVTDDGWPYVQHRGGPAGFIRVLDRTHLAWADRTGNRQYITAGNLDHDDRLACGAPCLQTMRPEAGRHASSAARVCHPVDAPRCQPEGDRRSPGTSAAEDNQRLYPCCRR